jgi:hypothetical protein
LKTEFPKEIFQFRKKRLGVRIVHILEGTPAQDFIVLRQKQEEKSQIKQQVQKEQVKHRII